MSELRHRSTGGFHGVVTLACLAVGCGNQASNVPVSSGGTQAGGQNTTATAVGGVIDPGSGGGTVEGGGGATGTGGADSGGARSTGVGGAAGSTRTASTIGRGGTPGTGGASDASVDARPDGSRTGGDRAGGASGAGGMTGAGGRTSVVGGNDGCDIGVYDPASPPKVLTLSGNLGVHDPVVIKSDGTYYLFATGLSSKTSTNLTSWTGGSRPFGAPSWLTAAVPGVTDLWAPDISYFNGKYHLYYSGSTFGKNRSCIGHATRDSMSSGTWTDQGSATICSNVDTSDNWNAIDPNVIIDTEGTPWLTFGSFWSGIKIIQLDDSGKRVGSEVTAIANRPSDGGAVEAPFMVRRCGTYYLFMSWDKCCNGASSTYNIRVVRGTSVTGPFADKAGTAAMQGGGTLVSQGDSTWAGPGHQAVLFEGTKAYLFHHSYAKSNGASMLRIAELVWDDSGWPVQVGP